MEITWILARDARFRYMLLDLMRQDCEYFLGCGGRRPSELWAGDVDKHIAIMKAVWNSFEVKPEWLSLKEIEGFEQKMQRP